ncbi:MAG: glycosyltransferase family 2 protein, partial [Oscillospiraceae bacterium]|nr:glycosyltransferase family 2 protein [Oscillospiraceae bacterium]
MPTVSVIIPVYNVEKYLSQCVESVVTQTYKKLEIILVNDGSTDTSGTLCNEWAKKDDRIKVIHKPNGGLADARNCGTAAATGKWILYIDSDDWYESADHIEKLVSYADTHTSDIVCFNYRRYFEKENKFSAPLCNADHPNPSLLYMVDNKIYTSSACLKLIKRSLLTDN